MNNEHEVQNSLEIGEKAEKSLEETHISRILAGEDFSKKHRFYSDFKDIFDPHEWRFIIWSSLIFIFCVVAFSSVGSLFTLFTPDESGSGTDAYLETTSTAKSQQVKQTGLVPKNTTYIAPSNQSIELPTRIEIPKVGINISVRNPSNTDYEVLDAELTKGAVRYPGSGYPGKGNMLLFGHSTGYKIVHNQAYKAFNNIKTLVAGDSVYIYTSTKTYEYKVKTVKEVNKYDTKISFDGVGDMITLSTCDSFGTKSDRYVVEAELVK